MWSNENEPRQDRADMPNGGVIVRKRDVKNHRYLRAHGLPHSATLADVHIEPAVKELPGMPAIKPVRPGFRGYIRASAA